MDAVNTFQIFDWLWTSGQLSENDLRQLQKEGFDCVINLALPISSNALKGEAEIAANLHMNYINIPVEWENPEVIQFKLCTELLNTFHANGLKVWLHCALNKRVSVFTYLYRKLVLKEGEELASHPMNEIWEPIPLWQEFIEDVQRDFAG
jgi:protein tyrosine phosphatase (PTP) superfamily phosphohydrolase (DUF442 family)